MGVQADIGILFGSIGFAAAGIILAFFFAFYVKNRTKDHSMKSNNAK
jgi:hypothetical protein